ncbi:MAG: tRNA (guanine(6)-N2)-methyltransferase [Candidatus Nezhaarchaeota archaeon]|nr:tRNA (guanine(6)-N2)-methyltransferase [Candidatus Nezhaarchaeota archaeon]
MLFFATTNRGLEDVAVRELREMSVEARAEIGKVVFQAELKDAIKLNLSSRTLHRIVLSLLRSEVEGLEDTYREVSSIDFTGLIDRNQSFAVRAERVGEHNFTSIDLASKVGQAIIDSYRQACGHRLRVDLKNPDVVIICILKGRELTVGIDLTGGSLHMRNYRVYDHPAALKTTIAASMVMLSGWRGDGALLDPMCGGGTIPIEAALIARRTPPGIFRRSFAYRKLVFIDTRVEEEISEELVKQASIGVYPVYGLDCFLKHIEGAKRNAASAGVADTVSFKVGDVFRLEKYVECRPEVVVTNPPYGLRSGPPPKRIKDFYLKMLKGMRAARASRALVITASRSKLIEAAKEEGVEVEETRPVMHGRLQAYILTMRL